jgi:hypothetical protein
MVLFLSEKVLNPPKGFLLVIRNHCFKFKIRSFIEVVKKNDSALEEEHLHLPLAAFWQRRN